MNALYDAALRREASRILDAVTRASSTTVRELRSSGALTRAVTMDVRRDLIHEVSVSVTVLEIVHRFLLPPLDDEALAAGLGMRITRSDEEVLRLEV